MKSVAVIGGGPAGLMVAEVLARGGASVTVYDRMPSLGRKFLLAGRGGLNLTHSEDATRFMQRYGRAAPRLQAAIDAFTPAMLRDWASELGQETFVGSSGRVFPKAMKASPLLRAWLRRLASDGVMVNLRHHWLGWDDAGGLVFDLPSGQHAAGVSPGFPDNVPGGRRAEGVSPGLKHESPGIKYKAVVLALGGASWPNLGSDGAWVGPLEAAGVTVAPLAPANVGVLVTWSDHFSTRFAGQPLKRLALRCGGHVVRGEALVTRHGLEGGAVYALSTPLREALARTGSASIEIDLRPDEAATTLQARLETPRDKQSISNVLRKAVRLSPAEIALLQEATLRHGKKLATLSAGEIAALVKSVPITVTGTASIARAISTAGGVAFDAIDSNFMLTARPGVFAAGEMLDWEAPTGGYLLQACLATGAAAGHGVLQWLNASADAPAP